MRQRAFYINHLGVSCDLNADGIRLNTGELNDWKLSILSLNGRVASMTAAQAEVPVTGIVFDTADSFAMERLDALYETSIVDVYAKQPGRLYVGEWYLEGYIVASSKGRTWWEAAGDFQVTMLSDEPLWTREHTQEYQRIIPGPDDDLNYPHDFPHDYAPSSFASNLYNESPMPCPVKLIIPGPADSWRVRIADNVYSATQNLIAGELLIIDGKHETITYIDALGNENNAFSKRSGVFKEGSGSFVFEKVPPGVSDIGWNGCNGFHVVVYEQRHERPNRAGDAA